MRLGICCALLAALVVFAGCRENRGDLTVTLPEGIPLEMIWVKPGEFMMGHKNAWGTMTPYHKVTLSKGYWLGRYEVTREQWAAIMGADGEFVRDRIPMGGLNRTMALEFCRRLTRIERNAGRLPEGFHFTLPTMAQWEYACRADTVNYGSTLWVSEDIAWLQSNSHGRPHPVGGRYPNSWGFFDMYGNVAEMCLDGYFLRNKADAVDPVVEDDGFNYSLQGGSYNSESSTCLPGIGHAYQDGEDWNYQDPEWGFRIACVRENKE